MKNCKFVLSMLLLIALTSALVVYSPHPASLTLADGSILRLEGVTYGTNDFVKGTILERVLERWLPPNGFGYSGFKLQHPRRYENSRRERDDFMTVWLSASDSKGTSVRRDWGRNLRVVAFKPGGTEYENSPPNLHRSSQFSREQLLVLDLTAFPRDGGKIGVRLLELNGRFAWTNAGEFFVRSLARGRKTPWNEQTLPATNRSDGWDGVLAKLIVATGSASFASVSINSELHFRLEREAVPVRRWKLDNCIVTDPAGNFHRLVEKRSDLDGGKILTSRFALNPADVWRIEVEVLPDLIPPSLEYHSFRVPADSNEHLFTNELGTVVLARLDRSMLEMGLPMRSRPNKRLVSAVAKDELSQNAGITRNVDVLGWDYRRTRWEISAAPKVLDITVGIQQATYFEFHAKPTLDRIDLPER